MSGVTLILAFTVGMYGYGVHSQSIPMSSLAVCEEAANKIVTENQEQEKRFKHWVFATCVKTK